MTEGESCQFQGDLSAQFPLDAFVRKNQIRCHVEAPLRSHSGDLLGVLAIQHDQDRADIDDLASLLDRLTARVTGELERIRQDHLLVVSERRFATLVGNFPGMVYQCRNDRDWTIIFTGEGVLELTGYAPDFFVNNRRLCYASIIHSEDRERVWDCVQEAIGSRTAFEVSYRIRTACGAEKWVWERGRLVEMEGAESVIEGFIHDITAQREADRVIRDSEERYSLAFEASHDCLWDLDLVAGKLVWNAAYEKAFVGGVDINAGKPIDWWSARIHPGDRASILGGFETMLEEPETIRWQREYRFRKAGGEYATVFSRCIFQRDEAGVAVRAVGTVQDITERRAIDEAMLRVSEEERRKIGRDIHDDLCQQLFGIQCSAQMLEDELDQAGSNELAEHMAKIVEMIGDANQSARRTAHGLAPLSLGSEGLAEALSQLAAEVEAAHGIRCELHCDESGPDCAKDLVIQLYRIAQEAVQNAVKHGKAKVLEIDLGRWQDGWRLRILDDGVGLPAVPNREGMGIMTMEHRARSVGATFKLAKRTPCDGTEVCCNFAATRSVNPKTKSKS